MTNQHAIDRLMESIRRELEIRRLSGIDLGVDTSRLGREDASDSPTFLWSSKPVKTDFIHYTEMLKNKFNFDIIYSVKPERNKFNPDPSSNPPLSEEWLHLEGFDYLRDPVRIKSDPDFPFRGKPDSRARAVHDFSPKTRREKWQHIDDLGILKDLIRRESDPYHPFSRKFDSGSGEVSDSSYKPGGREWLHLDDFGYLRDTVRIKSDPDFPFR